ncbi:proteasome assembly chaperone family protein [Zhihengliuella halotolerans]|uniref:Putative ATP-grasp superfamily ATP-dependent carboligase n=1 Tax=Zhihengliuella halotolerans TaxID=370736 RepID=A0A4Q8AC23_9MICC|nr:PAC2 family protein [Zhihengliuella halotolerans]RZU61133.1 putative ATP-grasp superfamily ATP-dependent carboligase [Zhihengliuella halotolerans]
MLDPLSLIRLNDEVVDDASLQGRDLIIALDGHADAGHVLRQVRGTLLDELDARLVATFDADQLINYRERRPQITFLGDHFTAYQRPRIELYALTDGLGTPFLLLTGPEPDLQWDRFAAAVVRLSMALNVRLAASFNGVPMPVPHTRRLGVTVYGNRPDLAEGVTTWNPTAEVPASAAHLIELELAQRGRDVVGFTLHVPHYLGDAEYPQVAVAALEHLGAAMGLGLPTDRLREAGRSVGEQIESQVAGSPEIQRMVSKFEQRFDEHVPQQERRSLLLGADEQLPDGDDLGHAIEAYLSGRRAEDD